MTQSVGASLVWHGSLATLASLAARLARFARVDETTEQQGRPTSISAVCNPRAIVSQSGQTVFSGGVVIQEIKVWDGQDIRPKDPYYKIY